MSSPPPLPTDYYDVIDRPAQSGAGREFAVFSQLTPCEGQNGREDVGLRSQSDSDNVPVLFAAELGRTINFNQLPFCIAATVTIPLLTELRHILNIVDILDFTGGGTSFGNLQISRTEIVFELGGQSVQFTGTFSPSENDIVNLQVCVAADGSVTLYINCVAVGTGSVPVSALDTADTNIYFLNNGPNTNNTARHMVKLK